MILLTQSYLQISLKPLLILLIPIYPLVMTEVSVDPPDLASWLPSLPALQPLLIFPVRDGFLARVKVTTPSQIFLRPLLILPTQVHSLVKVEISVDPPEMSQRLPSLPVLWPLLIFPV